MGRFVVCGEALIDLSPGDSAPGTTFRSSWDALSAGGPLNTAIALARLDQPVEFCGRLSSDHFGRQLRSHLAANRVGLDLLVVSDQPTSLAVVSLDEQQNATYTFHFAGTANFGWVPDELPDLDEDDWLHVASLATVVDPGAGVLLEWFGGSAARVSLDVNVRPSVIPDPDAYWARVEPWLVAVGRRDGVIKASDDDVRFLARATGAVRGGAGEDDPVAVLGAWVERFGAAVGVLTLGAHGAAAVPAGGDVVRRPGRRVEVVDTVGAGDTFMAGFLAAYAARPDDLAYALDRGIAASALVCGRQGPQPPTDDEVGRLVRG